MKFLHIEDFFHPNAGYQVNLLTRLQVKQGHEVVVLTGEIEKSPNSLTSFFGKDNINEYDQRFTEKNGVKIERIPIYGYFSGRAIFKNNLLKQIKKISPDVIFLHGNDTLTSIRILLSISKLKIPIVTDNHMLEIASINKFSKYFRYFYKKIITPIIIKNNIPVIRVVDSSFVQDAYNIPLDKTILLSFGTDVDFYKPDSSIKKEMRKEFSIKDNDFVVIYAGKLDKQKGGEFLANTLKDKIELETKDIVFVIIGNTSNDDFGKNIEDVFLNSKNKIIRLPTQTYNNLAKYYQMADLAVFPKQCSMSYFEVQSCGLPVVLELNEINTERIEGKRGQIFELNSEKDFINKIINFGNMNETEFNEYIISSRNNIIENYNYSKISQEFTKIMIDTFNKKNHM